MQSFCPNRKKFGLFIAFRPCCCIINESKQGDIMKKLLIAMLFVPVMSYADVMTHINTNNIIVLEKRIDRIESKVYDKSTDINDTPEMKIIILNQKIETLNRKLELIELKHERDMMLLKEELKNERQ